MSSLSWRQAAKDDRVLLQDFACTEPQQKLQNGRKAPHARPWEWGVQAWFRDRQSALADAARYAKHGGRLLVATKDGHTGFAACVSLAHLTEPSIETPLRTQMGWDGPIWALKALAVHSNLQRQGISCEVYEYVFQEILKEENYSDTLVIARIHPSNLASEKAAERAGFGLINDLPQPDENRNWVSMLIDEA
ncbi:GNAT family N-acetyltransferase [Streptacidiphilus sp. N1-12]|uniref:GNAT family N-acetyltransferase n=2 Tax=Streptacidiphilus alkalitolerans TaxID=3342712 RepID=A0ABV6WCN2_9ACTN